MRNIYIIHDFLKLSTPFSKKIRTFRKFFRFALAKLPLYWYNILVRFFLGGMAMFRTHFSVADLLVMLAMVAFGTVLILLFLFGNFSGLSDGVLVVRTPEKALTYPLSSDCTFSVISGDITLTIEIRDGCARVAESDCPDRICQKTGWISRKGETVICAPASVSLTVTDAKGGVGDADLVI